MPLQQATPRCASTHQQPPTTGDSRFIRVLRLLHVRLLLLLYAAVLHHSCWCYSFCCCAAVVLLLSLLLLLLLILSAFAGQPRW